MALTNQFNSPKWMENKKFERPKKKDKKKGDPGVFAQIFMALLIAIIALIIIN